MGLRWLVLVNPVLMSVNWPVDSHKGQNVIRYHNRHVCVVEVGKVGLALFPSLDLQSTDIGSYLCSGVLFRRLFPVGCFLGGTMQEITLHWPTPN